MNTNEVFLLITNNLKTIVPDIKEEDIAYDSRLCLLGVGSVGRAELIEKTIEDLELQSNRFEFHSANNLGELADLLSQKMRTR
ncbi:poly(3-hydroxyalkanoate) depolymerase [Aquimarina sp. RZ0]|uniref:poly(3-hydroxyalkanoate) depolymerase n=1 Tax=Aquimarina sp. RZ0 TaxID=2607730 RepID=UPI0011F38D2B|nr:poly(3-hydroxyalkanoate) depolymerase [Aquimarina sp. RZ0]KAA1246066.1 poly(3-hydroxyalkanoate) depolymerase [Aquimarina sp. RZ0]